jgi:sensor histidine kinase regulating citrate/malate metabolism
MEAKDAAILREQVKQLHNMDSGGVYTEIRGMRHDMKNHLSNIRLLMKQSAAENTGSIPELNEYINRMGETLEKLDFAFKTGNSVSDVVIHQAYIKARQNGIRFDSEFFYPSALDVNAYDLAVILQNALENACEACITVPEEKRFINIRSRIKGEIFFVEVSNSYTGKVSLDSQTGLPPTSKTESSAHGLGLANIQRAVKKHQGNISIQLTENNGIPVFKLTVTLQSEPE